MMFKVLHLAVVVSLVSTHAFCLDMSSFDWRNVEGRCFVSDVQADGKDCLSSGVRAWIDLCQSAYLMQHNLAWNEMSKDDKDALKGDFNAMLADAKKHEEVYLAENMNGRDFTDCYDYLLRYGVNEKIGRVVSFETYHQGSYSDNNTERRGEMISDIKKAILSSPMLVRWYDHPAFASDDTIYHYSKFTSALARNEDLATKENCRFGLVVGWNDSISPTLFRGYGATQMIKSGAWIVKTGYGTSYGQEGYIYVAYDDKLMFNYDGRVYGRMFDLPHYKPIFGNEQEYGKLYCHTANRPEWLYLADGSGASQDEPAVKAFGNMFTADADGMLSAIGIYLFEETYTRWSYSAEVRENEAAVTISIYTNCTDRMPWQSAGGIPLYSYTTNNLADGYCHIDLPHDIKVEKGARFFVSVSSANDKTMIYTSHTDSPQDGESYAWLKGLDDNYNALEGYLDLYKCCEYFEDSVFSERDTTPFITAYVKQEEQTDFIVTSEEIDGQRLLAFTTMGSNQFWKDVESELQLSKGLFTANVGASAAAKDPNPYYLAIVPEKGAFVFGVDAPDGWTVRNDCSWMQVPMMSGGKGKTAIKVLVEANTDGEIRKGRLVFTCKGEVRMFTFVQDEPRVLKWNVFGRGTHVEQDRNTGDDLEDPCLVANEKFVLRLCMNHFDWDRYPVRSIIIVGEPKKQEKNPATRSIELNIDVTSSRFVSFEEASYIVEQFELADKLPMGDGFHGAYDFSIAVSCDEIPDITVEEGDGPVSKKVFFYKEEKDDGATPNWYVYWKKDGAVKTLTNAIEYNPVNGSVKISRATDFAVAMQYIDKANDWGMWNGASNRVEIYNKASGYHYYHNYDDDGLCFLLEAGGLQFSYDWEYGIYTLANVIAHEAHHGLVSQRYADEIAKAEIPVLPNGGLDNIAKANLKKIDSDYGDQPNGGRGNLVPGLIWDWYEPLLHKYKANGVWIEREYCDSLTDTMESEINTGLGKDYGFSLSATNVDTYDLGTHKDTQYYAYGDNEFMSLLNGALALFDGTAVEENDWAYPGHQSYLPPNVGRKPKDAALKPSGSKAATNVKAQQTNEMTQEDDFVISNGVISACVNNASCTAGGRSIDYEFTFDVQGSGGMRFVGYLIDPLSNVVATASTEGMFDESNGLMTLRFDAGEISATGYAGPYTLYALTMHLKRDTEYQLVWAGSDLVTDWVSLESQNPVDDYGIAQQYGPYETGKMVSIAFTNGATWQETGLPAGLNWDVELPGVTGIPTEPGTNTVWFSWTETTGASNVEHKVSTTFIVVEKVAAYLPEIEGDCDDVTQGGAAVGQTVRMYTFDEKTEGYTNWVCTGWMGTGDVPATGTSNEMSFVVKDGGAIRWVYQTNYWVSVDANVSFASGEDSTVRSDAFETNASTGANASTCDGGRVVVKDAAGVVITNELWAAAGTNLTAEATANEGWMFAGWREADGGRGATALPEGDHAGRVTLPVTHPWMLEAVFTQKVFAVTFDLGEHGSRSGGGELTQTVTWGDAAVAPTVAAKTGWKFAGWDVAFTNVAQTLTVTAQYVEFVQEGVSFTESSAIAAEGDAVEVTVAGGDVDKASSIQVYLAYLTAAAADIDLKTATVDGVTPKGGLKFPLTLNWAAGEIGTKTISIPVKADKAVEGNETLVFQLDSPTGIALGENDTCQVSLVDSTIPSTVSLSQGVNNPSLKANTSGAGKWTVVLDGAAWKTEERGIYNIITPTLARGKSSTLTLGGVSGAGQFLATFRFIGDDDDSTLTIYADKDKARTFEHSDTGNVWQTFRMKDGTKGSHTYSYVFTQGSNLDVRVEMACAYWIPDGQSEPVMQFATVDEESHGFVTGMGYYAVDATAKLTATAYPGYEFDAWYRYSNKDSEYMVYSYDAKLAFKVTESLDLMATFKSIPYISALANPADGGKVTGSSCCAAGKKVTLKATANKGFVFMGWYRGRDALVASEKDDDSERCGAGAASTCVATTSTLVIDRSAKPTKSSATQTVLTDVDESTTFYAKFITVEEDKSNIVATVNGMECSERRDEASRPRVIETNIWTGVYFEWPVAASALSATTVKVAGLPSGLKFTAKPVTTTVTTGSGKSKVTTIVTNVPANTIYGAPTAASKTKKVKAEGEGEQWMAVPSQIKVTVTTAGKSSQTFEIDATVDPLPSWVVGTFTGPSYDGGRGATALPDVGVGEDGYYVVGSAPRADREETNGLATVTIGANGKISAKQPVDGKSTSFAASYFDSYAETDDLGPAFHATLTAKVGKEVVTNEMSVCGGLIEAALPADAGGTCSVASVTNGYIEADRFDAWQYNWKSEPWKSIVKVLDKETMTYYVMSDGSCADVDAESLRVDTEWASSERRGEDTASTGVASMVLGVDGVVGKVTLKFAASGAVTVSGEFAQLDADGQPVYKKSKLQTVKATGSATLVPAGEDYGHVFVYLAPKGLQPHARCVEASWAQHIVTWEYGDAEHWYVCFKPVIYLYPETNATCRVQLALNGELTCTYPEYGADGWRDFIASPDGTLTFPNGSRYYCLYWEGETDAEWDFSSGYCVKGSETASFFADILLQMGLTFREANEFIVYWLPLMQDNPYNIISFQDENYANAAKLSVDPQPDSLLRVFMAWRPSDRLVDIPAPVIVPFERKGFTVVEWGGTKVGE